MWVDVEILTLQTSAYNVREQNHLRFWLISKESFNLRILDIREAVRIQDTNG